MTTTKAVVLLGFCVVFATANIAEETPLSLTSTLEQHTTAANKALASSPAACTRDSARRIQEANIKVFGDVASCSAFAITKNIAYIMIDSADFGSTFWSDGEEVVAAVKACNNETDILNRVECWDTALSSSNVAIQGIYEAINLFVNQLIAIIPKIEGEISACQKKSTLEYKLFLDVLVQNAKTC